MKIDAALHGASAVLQPGHRVAEPDRAADMLALAEIPLVILVNKGSASASARSSETCAS